MQPTVLHVFVSSTWLDLQPERAAVETALQRLRETKFVGMECFGSRDEDTRHVSLDEVDRSQVYVGIFGGRYGSGITEAEYRWARELGLPCFIYFKDEAAIPSEGHEADPEKAARLTALKVELRQQHTVTTFNTPDDLAAKVTADLHRWLFDEYLAPRLERAVQQGNLAEIRRLAEATRDEAALRQALTQRGITVGGNVTESLLVLGDRNVINFFVQGITRLPTDYASRIQNFLTEYLGTLEQPVPFGGRDTDLGRLDTWLADPHAPPYLLLAAPAGRGKSALLVRWSQRLLAQNDTSLVFVPVSIRFRTNLAPVVFAALAARLAHLYGEEVPQTADLTAEQWRGLVSTYLARTPPDGRSLLLILDGVDEAADWEPGPDLFPLVPPPGLRVIVSARYRAGDADAAPWLRRLGWERPGLACPMDLAPLARPGVADVLQKMGFPLDVLARDVDIVSELHRLSEGDPLLVRLYVDDLWALGEEAARLRPEDLRAIRPGLKGYFDRWWEDQRRLWGPDVPLKEPAVQALLNLLACALGPLNQEDVWALGGDVGLTTWMLEEALRPLDRFVIGDGKTQGYVFGHPRLGEYFHGRLTGAERQVWEQRFLDWGRQTLAHLDAGALVPEEAPAYVVQYYGAHLERRGGLAESLFALVSDGWRRAWEALEGAYSGFLTDVERSWRAARVVNGVEATTGCLVSHLEVEVRSALCRASVNSLSGNVPPALLAALVKQGVWTPAQGLAYARQVPEPRQRTEALAELAPYLPEAERTEALGEALATVRAIKQEQRRAETLTGLASCLPEPLLREALAVARQIEDKYWRAEALAGLVSHLPEALLREALVIAQAIEWEWAWARVLVGLIPRLAELSHLQEVLSTARALLERDWLEQSLRVEVLVKLAPHLPETERAEALREALAAVQTIRDKWARAEVLAKLAPHLPEALLREAVAVARQIEDKYWRTEALAGLAPYLPEAERAEALQEALAAARKIESRWSLAEVLTKLVPHLPEAERTEIFREALAAARAIEWENDRAEVLVVLVPYLPEVERAEALREALAAVRAIGDKEDQAGALAGLAPWLSEAERAEILWEILAAARAIELDGDRAKALVGLAPWLPEAERAEILHEALAATWEILDDDDRAKALAGLAPHLPEPLLREALAAARAIESKLRRAEALAGLASHLPEAERAEALREALTAARAVKNEWGQAKALVRLASCLPEAERAEALREALLKGEALACITAEEGTEEALEEARIIWDKRDRAEALAGLALHLPEAERAKVLREALAAARAIEWEDDRAKVLTGLALHLPKAERTKALREALAAVRAIGDKEDRAESLAGLAPWLVELGHPQEALAAVQAIEEEWSQAEALAGLAPHLPEALLREALVVARAVRYVEDRAEALAGLAPHLTRLPRQHLYPLWQETLPILAARTRKDLLADLGALSPVIAALGGAEAVAETFRAIQDVGRWWP